LEDWSEVLLKTSDSLEDAIKVLHVGGLRVSLVVDNKGKLLGTITDGDIRRALLNYVSFDSLVTNVMNHNPRVASASENRDDLLLMMRNEDILHVPIVDKDGILCGLETIQHLIKTPKFDNPVFLMAGGFGKRLLPLTKDTPKPLLKVSGKPILENILEQFISYGFHDFYISTHFKSEQIREYFKNGELHNISIKYVHEDVPLGTAGSLGLLPDNLPDLPIIVMNGDLLTKVDFTNLLDFHGKHDLEATMCVREYDFQVPYGVVEIDNYSIKDIKEKPVHSFFVNAGIYVLNRELINKVDGKSYLDMTDFLEKELKSNGVSAFPIYEYWIDIGKIEEYERANIEIPTFFD
jgi:dTDP-glucose pyrophosphorylase